MAVPAAADTQRPNVILILMDDMGWEICLPTRTSA